MKSDGFLSNEKVVEQLGFLLESERFPHAIVIEGEQGIGKKTLARLIARALVCRGEDKPCGECSQCRKAQQNIHPDIFEYTATGGERSFHVETVRQVINDVYMQPNEAEYKVYILGNADCMSDSAQNAILKVLEEPPSYAVFILTAQSKSSLLETVLSRCVVVSLDGVDFDLGARYICEHMSDVDFAMAKSAVETFDGNIGKAMDSLQSSKTSELIDVCNSICRALIDDNEYSLLTACSVFQKDRQSIVFSLELLKNIFRDALFYTPESDIISGHRESAQLLKSKLTKQKLLSLIDACNQMLTQVKMNVNNALIITKICYCLRQAIGR